MLGDALTHAGVDDVAQFRLGDLYAPHVVDQVFDLLFGEGTAAGCAPSGHHVVAPVVEHVAHLVLAVAGQHGVERRSRPGHRGHEVALCVGDGDRRRAARSLGAVALLAVGALGVELAAAVSEDAVGVLDQTLVAPGFAQPVEGQPHPDDGQHGQPGQKRLVELGAFQLLVLQVGLAVGGQLDLAADLVAGGARVEDQVHDVPDEDDGQDDEPDGSLRGGG